MQSLPRAVRAERLCFLRHKTSGVSLLPSPTPCAPPRRARPFRRLSTAPLPHANAPPQCDVQGAELDVIRGAQRLADSIEVVVLEVSLVSYNEGAPGISKVVSTMFLHGFDIIDVAEVHYWASSLEILGQMDLVFAQRGSPLFAAYGRAMGLVAR